LGGTKRRRIRIHQARSSRCRTASLERFNRRCREAVLNMYIFETLDEVRTETEKWLGVYNQPRPYESLGNLSPMEYLQKFNLETVI
jgi:transposase InsO family protein